MLNMGHWPHVNHQVLVTHDPLTHCLLWLELLSSQKRLVKALQKADYLPVDGTFRTAHSPYKQFVTIYRKVNGFVVPSVFLLMAWKHPYNTDVCSNALNSNYCRLLNSPSVLVKWYATSRRGFLLQFEFQRPRLPGCHSHFGQCLLKQFVLRVSQRAICL
jgi:hypothetical protein